MMTNERLQHYQTRILKECSTGAAVTIVLREMLDEDLAGNEQVHDVDVAWIATELERGHYSILRARLAEYPKDSIVPEIIREELLQLACAASRDRGRMVDYIVTRMVAAHKELHTPSGSVIGLADRAREVWTASEYYRGLYEALMQTRMTHLAADVDALLGAEALAPPAPRVAVAGERMERPIYAFVLACDHLLADEQAKPNPDNALIAVLCDAVRLTRELEAMARRPL